MTCLVCTYFDVVEVDVEIFHMADLASSFMGWAERAMSTTEAQAWDVIIATLHEAVSLQDFVHTMTGEIRRLKTPCTYRQVVKVAKTLAEDAMNPTAHAVPL